MARDAKARTLREPSPAGHFNRRLTSAAGRRLVALCEDLAAHLIRDATESLSVEALAQWAGLSASRLRRLFKQQTGVTLLDFRNRQRIERFLERYGNGQRVKMLEAALEAGFGSYPKFHRVLKEVMGCSPAAYRRTQAG